MKVIIIDKNADVPDWKRILNTYRKAFESKGHYIEICRKLSEIGELGDLGRYDIAVAHPELSSGDVSLLDKEVKERPEFRVIFTSGDPYREERWIKIKQSDQVIYHSRLLSDDLVELVENGWKYLEQD
jgi:hypothetical protein